MGCSLFQRNQIFKKRLMMHVKRKDIIAGLNAPCQEERWESVYGKKSTGTQ